MLTFSEEVHWELWEVLAIVPSLSYDSLCVHQTPVTDNVGHNLTAPQNSTGILYVTMCVWKNKYLQ